jgi:3-oxoacyl-[acyl-carrier protein] reductase
MSEHTSLANKVAIITGGGTGIGHGVALALAQEGAKVIVCGRRRDRIESAAREIEQSGGECLAVQADVSVPADVERLVKTVMEKFGQIDVLVNNAGIVNDGQTHNISIKDWDAVMATNIRGPFLLTRAVLPIMREQRSGHILNISSESGLNYYMGDAAYGLSKHALNDFSEYIQRENQDFNIRVNTICPGMVVTEMSAGSVGLDESKCLYPDDIAELAIWLLTRRQNIKIGTPILIQTMLNPWK